MKANRIILPIVFILSILNIIEIVRIMSVKNSFENYIKDENEILEQDIINSELRLRNIILLQTEEEKEVSLNIFKFGNEKFAKNIPFRKEDLKRKNISTFEKRQIDFFDTKRKPFLIKKAISNLQNKLESQHFLKYCFFMIERDYNSMPSFEIIKPILEDSIHIGYYAVKYPETKVMIEYPPNNQIDWNDNYNHIVDNKSHINLNYSILQLNHNGLRIDTFSMFKKLKTN